MTSPAATSPIRPVRVGMPRARIEAGADGSTLVRALDPLRPYPSRFTAHLEHWARAAPDRALFARRGPDGEWRRITHAEALRHARAIGQALLDRGLSAERPVMILSGNSLEHAMLALGCMHAGIPCAPVSAAYSLVSTDFAKLRHCVGLLTPGLVFADDGARFGRAIRAVVPEDAEIVTAGPAPEGRAATPFAELLATAPGPALDAAAAEVGPDTIAKFLFTSGSTGVPKAVITTHRMLCSNQQMLAQAYPVLEEEPPVIVDWLPWNHTFGGSHNFGIPVARGGTLYIDEGRPVAGGMEESIRNLREIAPTAYFNVPKGFEELARHLERDPALRAHFFSRVKLLFYAAAGLPQPVWDAMDNLALRTVGERIQWMTGLGSTETAPFALCCRPDVVASGIIGLPAAGIDVKLAPVADKLEIRVRGPNVTPGYWRMEEQSRACFDAEGYYRMGDAAAWVEPADPGKGLRFDGRIAEDFKLATGTFVSVGPMRAKLTNRLAPYVRDVVVAGADRDYVAVLALPDSPEIAGDPAILAEIRERLRVLATEATGSASRVERLAFLTAPLSIDAGELTDKGSLNQRTILRNHAQLVEALYDDPPPPHVLCAREFAA